MQGCRYKAHRKGTRTVRSADISARDWRNWRGSCASQRVLQAIRLRGLPTEASGLPDVQRQHGAILRKKMETELTKKIKKACHSYRPKLPTKMRTIRWAEEVWTPTGIVDCLRFEDYYKTDLSICPYLHPDKFKPEIIENMYASLHPIGTCFRDGSTTIDNERCRGCVFILRGHEIGMMCTCYEVKITYADFHSPNGHNFHGNENYYVVPAELAPKIEAEVPEDIGILVWKETNKTEGLRMYKPSGWQEVPDDVMVQLLYNAMKKWCDGAAFV